eukprot:TRINITY_DN1679_c0_g1_i2.p1 TRINITY_DN1679_c0_g1~~TRINITY_DN1679_c0_g1_i2.p1  ORF type:complete len:340 (+),score=65.77 TRINITY_DN1679_c0_g1_i2:191-1210(+)
MERRPFVFVVGVDGSNIAMQAFHATCRMLDRRKDKLYLIHVTNPGRYQEMAPCFHPDTIRSTFETAYIREDLMPLQASGNLEFEIREKTTPADKVRHMVTEFAHEKGADVLVLGSYGAKSTASGGSSMERIKRREGPGTTAVYAVQHAQCTCVLIKESEFAESVEQAQKQRVKYMVLLACVLVCERGQVAVDGSDVSHEGYMMATALASPTDEMDVVSLERHEDNTPAALSGAAIEERYNDENAVYFPTGTMSLVDRNSDERAQTVPERLCHLAMERSATLLCLGSEGLSGASTRPHTQMMFEDHWTPGLGSVANWALNKGRCSVLVVKSGLGRSPIYV